MHACGRRGRQKKRQREVGNRREGGGNRREGGEAEGRRKGERRK